MKHSLYIGGVLIGLVAIFGSFFLYKKYVTPNPRVDQKVIAMAPVEKDKDVQDVVKGKVKIISGNVFVVDGVNVKQERGTYRALVDEKTFVLPEGKRFSDIQIGDRVAMSAATFFSDTGAVVALKMSIAPTAKN